MYRLPMQVEVKVGRATFMQLGMLRAYLQCVADDGRVFEVKLKSTPKQGYFSGELIADCLLVDSPVTRDIPVQPSGYTLTVQFDLTGKFVSATLS